MGKKSVRSLARDWWAMGLCGLAAVVAAVIILVTPYPRADSLLRVFGGYLLIDGCVMLALAMVAARRHKRWAKSALSSLMGVLFGLANLIGGSVPLLVRANLIAFRTLVVGVSGIITARRLRVQPAEALLVWLLILAGVGSVIFSVVIALSPLLKGPLLEQLSWLAASYLFSLGSLFLVISAWLRLLNQRLTAAATA